MTGFLRHSRQLGLTIGAMIFLAGAAVAGTISVQGTGVIAAKPDMATVRVAVTTEDTQAGRALSLNSERMTRVLSALTRAGVAPRDMQTSGLSLQPRWTSRQDRASGAPLIDGFTVVNQLVVDVQVLDQLGELLDVVVREGANGFQDLRFGLREAEALRDTARALAVADARRKAEIYAQAAGVTLGAPELISETGGGSAPVMQMEMRAMAASDAVPLAQGELAIRADINIVYAIRPAAQ
ncbi:MAG: hypothetical protein ACI9IV_001739 [Paracoccaceae bacterium]|jgi:uncharacterized protein YggE